MIVSCEYYFDYEENYSPKIFLEKITFLDKKEKR